MVEERGWEASEGSGGVSRRKGGGVVLNTIDGVSPTGVFSAAED